MIKVGYVCRYCGEVRPREAFSSFGASPLYCRDCLERMMAVKLTEREVAICAAALKDAAVYQYEVEKAAEDKATIEFAQERQVLYTEMWKKMCRPF